MKDKVVFGYSGWCPRRKPNVKVIIRESWEETTPGKFNVVEQNKICTLNNEICQPLACPFFSGSKKKKVVFKYSIHCPREKTNAKVIITEVLEEDVLTGTMFIFEQERICSLDNTTHCWPPKCPF